jgi:alanine racemase
MGRSGFDWRCVDEWLPALRSKLEGGVTWVGVQTHLHSADEDVRSVQEQWRRFTSVLEAIGDGRRELSVHVLNSAGAFRAPEYASALVRPGIFLYGGAIGDGQPTPEPVVSVLARVVHVRDAPAGTTVGYGVTHAASGLERWATLSIGYGDGLPRALGNRGSALIDGRRVPMIGRISMDVTVVDISDVPDVAVGDVATLLGSDGDEAITVDEVAGLAGTISYEVLTGLTPRLPRVWKGGPGSFHG